MHNNWNNFILYDGLLSQEKLKFIVLVISLANGNMLCIWYVRVMTRDPHLISFQFQLESDAESEVAVKTKSDISLFVEESILYEDEIKDTL
jgi:hypothetical protein